MLSEESELFTLRRLTDSNEPGATKIDRAGVPWLGVGDTLAWASENAGRNDGGAGRVIQVVTRHVK